MGRIATRKKMHGRHLTPVQRRCYKGGEVDGLPDAPIGAPPRGEAARSAPAMKGNHQPPSLPVSGCPPTRNAGAQRTTPRALTCPQGTQAGPPGDGRGGPPPPPAARRGAEAGAEGPHGLAATARPLRGRRAGRGGPRRPEGGRQAGTPPGAAPPPCPPSPRPCRCGRRPVRLISTRQKCFVASYKDVRTARIMRTYSPHNADVQPA